MYQRIARHKQVLKKYAEKLISEGVVTEKDYAVSSVELVVTSGVCPVSTLWRLSKSLSFKSRTAVVNKVSVN